MTVSDALKRIEEKHPEDRDGLCTTCWIHAPCDVVKLARALDTIADPKEPDSLGEPLSRLLLAQEIARRVLREVADV
jgi:hypothetical protein